MHMAQVCDLLNVSRKWGLVQVMFIIGGAPPRHWCSCPGRVLGKHRRCSLVCVILRTGGRYITSAGKSPYVRKSSMSGTGDRCVGATYDCVGF